MTNANACTDPDNCRLCKALHLPGASTEGLYHAGIPLGDHADERARLRALAEKAANPELDHWQRTHALWELRAALSPPVVLGLLDAADRAEAAERDRDACRRSSDSRWSTAVELTAALDAATARAEKAVQKRDAAKRLLAESLAISGSAVEAMRSERARAERLEAALRLFYPGAGCPVCSGDCAAANPPVLVCPMREARAALAEPAPGGQDAERGGGA